MGLVKRIAEVPEKAAEKAQRQEICKRGKRPGMLAAFLVAGILLLPQPVRARGGWGEVEKNLSRERALGQKYPSQKGEAKEEEKSDEQEIQEIYPLIYGKWPGRKEDVLVLKGEEQVYQVLPGDSLWSISEKLWGDGRWYGNLTLENGEAMENPNLIYPGMKLRAAQEGYLCKRRSQYVGVEMGDYAMDTPGSWTIGTISCGDACANLVMSGEGFCKIACLVQDKRAESVSTLKDWELCAEKIRAHAEEYYGEKVSQLNFEHYQMEQGEEVYLYSFLWQMELPEHPEIGKVKVRICMGMKLTEHIQAEFLGFANKYDIHGGVRYTTASFEEHVKDYDPKTFTVNDSNMSILPAARWELEGLYDPFCWADEFFGTLLERAAGVEPEDESVRDRVMERMERPGGRR